MLKNNVHEMLHSQFFHSEATNFLIYPRTLIILYICMHKFKVDVFFFFLINANSTHSDFNI